MNSDKGGEMKKLKVKDIVGQKVRLHSSMWVQGFCDGEVEAYDYDRGVFLSLIHI